MVCCNVFFGFPLLTRCKDPERILNWGQNLYIEKLECYDNVSLYTLASYKFQVYLIISIHFINNWNWDFNLEKLYDPDAMISITPLTLLFNGYRAIIKEIITLHFLILRLINHNLKYTEVTLDVFISSKRYMKDVLDHCY